ncbi:hypothetical protein C8R46DRAFT_1222172 [Mycena filopes]|nr:hypothetical protein C8R46DRAFT_1222172 [Mycena filopes]
MDQNAPTPWYGTLYSGIIASCVATTLYSRSTPAPDSVLSELKRHLLPTLAVFWLFCAIVAAAAFARSMGALKTPPGATATPSDPTISASSTTTSAFTHPVLTFALLATAGLTSLAAFESGVAWSHTGVPVDDIRALKEFSVRGLFVWGVISLSSFTLLSSTQYIFRTVRGTPSPVAVANPDKVGEIKRQAITPRFTLAVIDKSGFSSSAFDLQYRPGIVRT